jgi:hypothetical protein
MRVGSGSIVLAFCLASQALGDMGEIEPSLCSALQTNSFIQGLCDCGAPTMPPSPVMAQVEGAAVSESTTSAAAESALSGPPEGTLLLFFQAFSQLTFVLAV